MTEQTLRPGSTIGILGSGQLGRMLALAARPLGYRVLIYAPDPGNSPAAAVADGAVQAGYGDQEALKGFAAACDVVTVEFENIPSDSLEYLAAHTTVRPGAHALHVTQNRLREKLFLQQHGLPLAEFRHVRAAADLPEAGRAVGLPAVLKTAGFGYDGKGQVLLRTEGDFPRAEALLAEGDAVLEAFVPFEREVSVISARSATGETASYGLFSNQHANHILDVTSVESDTADADLGSRASELADGIMNALDYTGVLCVELFVLKDGGLLVNEIAPRVHNSGHLTIEASGSSQFQQHIRAICGLPLGSTSFHSPAAMANLLGDVWQAGEPAWAAALSDPRVQLHLYGKEEARAGRKMGHLTALADTRDEAESAVRAARSRAASQPAQTAVQVVDQNTTAG